MSLNQNLFLDNIMVFDKSQNCYILHTNPEINKFILKLHVSDFELFHHNNTQNIKINISQNNHFLIFISNFDSVLKNYIAENALVLFNNNSSLNILNNLFQSCLIIENNQIYLILAVSNDFYLNIQNMLESLIVNSYCDFVLQFNKVLFFQDFFNYNILIDFSKDSIDNNDIDNNDINDNKGKYLFFDTE